MKYILIGGVPVNKLLESALNYHELGYSIIPVRQDKKPMIKWEEYQKRRASVGEIKDWWKKHPDANIGIVTGKVSGLAVVDIDTEEGLEAIKELIPDSIEFPIVKTPGGGQHWYFACEDGNLSNNARTVKGCDLRANGGYVVAPPSKNGSKSSYAWVQPPTLIETPTLPKEYISYIYNNNIYNTLSLKRESIINNNIYNNTKDFKDLKNCKNHANTKNTESPTMEETNKRQTTTARDRDTGDDLFTLSRRDEDLFHTANCLIKGGMNPRFALSVLQTLASNCNPPFPKREAIAKVESALKRSERRQEETERGDLSLSQEVRVFIGRQGGVLTTTNVHQNLGIGDKRDKKTINRIMARLCEKGVLERTGRKIGEYRVVNSECEDIDFLNADDRVIDVRMPLGIEGLCQLQPKNLSVIAGTSNAGKTIWLLNLAMMNMDRFNINYFSSEMGAAELKKRLKHSGLPLEAWKSVRFMERSSNFADVIRPDDINIIDFLEVTDNFYQVGGMLKAIFDKLDNGLAFIALQKDSRSDYGRGGQFTVEKARIALAIDYGKLKITKGKIWTNSDINPNDMCCEFSLRENFHFVKESEWRRE